MTDGLPKARPFLKWAGGKRQLISVIEDHLPKEISEGKIERYIEPFIGGGALFFHLRENFPLKEFFISDFNPDLINAYVSVRDHVDALVKELEKIADEYLPLDHEARSEVFYRIRTEYNLTRSSLDSNQIQEKIVRAAQMIFLNRTCFNGLYRVNSKGDYNVPHGRYKNPQICNSENLHLVSEALQNVKITCGSYETCFENINHKTFIYFDPPYRPLPNTPSFTDYAQKATFGDEDQEKLSIFFKQISSGKKCFAMLSNSDPHVTDENDDFFDMIYSDFEINRVGARRAINSDGNKRGKITELLITNYNSLWHMRKRPNTVGGGAKTNENGLRFEARADLRDAITEHPDYILENDIVYFNGHKVAYYFEKHGLYKNFLEPRGVNFKSRISSKLLPDSALYVGSTMYIIEKKYQAASGSVSEKLQTCDFKKKQYEKLFSGLDVKIEYYYVLNDWFDQTSFQDVFEYIESVGCRYFIEYVPLNELGL